MNLVKGVAKLGKNGILLSEIESLIGHTRSIKKRMEKKIVKNCQNKI